MSTNKSLPSKSSAPGASPPVPSINIRAIALRVGIPLAIGWAVAFLIDGWIAKAVMGVLTLIVLAIGAWAYRFVTKSRSVSQLVQGASTKEARQEAIGKLETDFKKGDATALMAKAHLEMQEDPKRAQKTLESINLDKLMGPMADEVRAQRAMVHLMFGETDEARGLADAIDLSRHKEAKQRAMVAAIVAESWARSGEAKRSIDILINYDPNDEAFSDIRPQILRARAFAYAWANDTKQMKQALRALSAINPQFLSGFITKKKHPMGVPPRGVHPLLEKEAFQMLSASGTAGRKVEYRRG